MGRGWMGQCLNGCSSETGYGIALMCMNYGNKEQRKTDHQANIPREMMQLI